MPGVEGAERRIFPAPDRRQAEFERNRSVVVAPRRPDGHDQPGRDVADVRARRAEACPGFTEKIGPAWGAVGDSPTLNGCRGLGQDQSIVPSKRRTEPPGTALAGGKESLVESADSLYQRRDVDETAAAAQHDSTDRAAAGAEDRDGAADRVAEQERRVEPQAIERGDDQLRVPQSTHGLPIAA